MGVPVWLVDMIYKNGAITQKCRNHTGQKDTVLSHMF